MLNLCQGFLAVYHERQRHVQQTRTNRQQFGPVPAFQKELLPLEAKRTAPRRTVTGSFGLCCLTLSSVSPLALNDVQKAQAVKLEPERYTRVMMFRHKTNDADATAFSMSSTANRWPTQHI